MNNSIDKKCPYLKSCPALCPTPEQSDKNKRLAAALERTINFYQERRLLKKALKSEALRQNRASIMRAYEAGVPITKIQQVLREEAGIDVCYTYLVDFIKGRVAKPLPCEETSQQED